MIVIVILCRNCIKLMLAFSHAIVNYTTYLRFFRNLNGVGFSWVMVDVLGMGRGGNCQTRT